MTNHSSSQSFASKIIRKSLRVINIVFKEKNLKMKNKTISDDESVFKIAVKFVAVVKKKKNKFDKFAMFANIKLVKVTSKFNLIRDENIVVFDSSVNVAITHRFFYEIYDSKKHDAKAVIVSFNNVKMKLFFSYSMYDKYCEMNFERVKAKHLSSSKIILSNF